MEIENKFEEVAENIENLKISEEDKRIIQENLLKLKGETINLMITGATGCGKSSTINALFGKEVAKVGTSVDPETMSISKYELKNLIIWDTPGLGDSMTKDQLHAKNIVNKLQEKDVNGDLLIDLVLVILDGGSKDLGTSFELITKVIIPALGQDADKRILVAINQCDMAMKGRYWDEEANKPEAKLIEFLENKVSSIRNRILEATGVNITPIYYSAGFKEDGMPQVNPYNLSKLLYFIVKYTPTQKRLAYIGHLNEDPHVWESNDNEALYEEEIEKGFWDTAKEYVFKGAKILIDFGPIFLPFLPKGGKIAKIGGKLIEFLGKIKF
ncbi:MAG: GTPase [Paludibacteraceae bacterium]|jgi:predicted GTPase|nr:GTPase [Paludibacteraceae bacterium]